jgi:photoactive yellow protein
MVYDSLEHTRAHSTPASTASTASTAFDSVDLASVLQRASPELLDALPMGVIALDHTGRVTAYNRFEQKLAGLRATDVVGRDFFVQVAPCTNNFMVRERFFEAWQAESPLDEVVPYTFTYRMKPTRVRLRLLVCDQVGWLVVQPR